MIDAVRWVNSRNKIFDSFPLKEKLLFPGRLRIIDQRKLPRELKYLELDDIESIFKAIKNLSVRGAPAIGCAAALGLASVMQYSDSNNSGAFISELRRSSAYLNESRPTAVNLSWALNRCAEKIESNSSETVDSLKLLLLKEALDILSEDIGMCRKIGKNGLSLINDGMGILTHCNAGALATGDYGTALSPIYAAHEKRMKIKVYADETRHLLQGSRLTAWELQRAGVEVICICDNMAAQVMKEGKIDLVIVGSDRIAANGDAANKIGSYGLAVLADYHKIPFYVAAPYSTLDTMLCCGDEIPIEQRNADEICKGFGKLTAPEDVKVYNPAFDIIPHQLIKGIITEKSIIEPPYIDNLSTLFY